MHSRCPATRLSATVTPIGTTTSSVLDAHAQAARDGLREKQSPHYVILTLSGDGSSISVEQQGPGDRYEFLDKLAGRSCRYGLCTVPSKMGETQVVFVRWTPVDAPAEEKTLYDSYEESARQALTAPQDVAPRTDRSEPQDLRGRRTPEATRGR
uniref:Cofilin n=1 Tax=Streptomyces lavendulae TaxID=1914 RepID=B0CN41_STRLA|nr:cofilin [Streptomyces lavendulae]